MKMVGRVDGPDQLASYLGKRSGKNRWLIGSWLLEWGYSGLANRILRRNEQRGMTDGDGSHLSKIELLGCRTGVGLAIVCLFYFYFIFIFIFVFIFIFSLVFSSFMFTCFAFGFI
jgi:hypothetical protein